MVKKSVFILLADIRAATRMVKAASKFHLSVRNFDSGEALMRASNEVVPLLVIIDWDDREAEGYQVLSNLTRNADLSCIPVIGYVSSAKRALIDEAQRAGCDRVYIKTDFLKEVDNIFVRYAR